MRIIVRHILIQRREKLRASGAAAVVLRRDVESIAPKGRVLQLLRRWIIVREFDVRQTFQVITERTKRFHLRPEIGAETGYPPIDSMYSHWPFSYS